MPDIPAELLPFRPIILRDTVRDRAGCIVLIAPHHFQNAVRIVRNHVIADHAVRHRDGEQLLRHFFPVIDRIVVHIGPVEAEVTVDPGTAARIGKIDRLLRVHRHKELDKCKKPGENPLVQIFFDLIDRLFRRDTRSLQLDMDERHAVDQQHHVAPAILQNLILSRKDRLLRDLIAAPSRRDLAGAEDKEADFLSVVKRIGRILPLDRHCSAINPRMERIGCLTPPDLLDQFVHLLLGQRAVIEPVDAVVVLIDDLRPVVDQVLLRRVA